jgi:hypothetical protein
MESGTAWQRRHVDAGAGRRWLVLALALLALICWLVVAVERIRDEEWVFAGCSVTASLAMAKWAHQTWRDRS